MFVLRMRNARCECAGEKCRHRMVGIDFRCHQRARPAHCQPTFETWPHAAADQHVHAIQRMGCMCRRLMETLLLCQFHKLLIVNIVLINSIDPEPPAAPGMIGDGAAILAGDSDAHGGVLSVTLYTDLLLFDCQCSAHDQAEDDQHEHAKQQRRQSTEETDAGVPVHDQSGDGHRGEWK